MNMTDNCEVFGRQVFSLSRQILESAGKKRHPELMAQLCRFRLLRDYEPESVAVNKFSMPSGCGAHDYYSQGAFWFPDPTRPDGLPYINLDGEINPEAENEFCDKNKKNRMFARIYHWAVIYFFTRDEDAAKKAATLLRHWFLLPETRMNPHVDFGQAIPGKCTGRDAGIIEFHFLIQIVDAVAMLVGSPHWSAADREGMKQWFWEFLDWLRNSRIGREESMAANNHGTWHTALSLKLASCCGRNDLIGDYLMRLKQRIAQQIGSDGSLAEELRRTQPWHYSLFCTSAFLAAATVALEHGEDLFNYRAANGAGIKSAVNFLAGFATGERPWPYPELYVGEYGRADFNFREPERETVTVEERFKQLPKTWPCPELYGFLPEKITPVLHIAAFFYRDARYIDILNRIPVYDDPASRLFYT